MIKFGVVCHFDKMRYPQILNQHLDYKLSLFSTINSLRSHLKHSVHMDSNISPS